jgi:lactoylglutathione lyase
MIKRIAHLAFGVKDMAKSMYFYTEIMGFQRAFTLYDDQKQPWIEYIKIAEGHFIELFYSDSKTLFPTQETSYQHLCLETDNLVQYCESIEKKGYPLDAPIILGLDHNFQACVKDPDGNRIELMEYGKEALQLQPVRDINS